MENNKTTLQHVVLYAKHWYKQTDLIPDLQKCLTGDRFSGEYYNKEEMAVFFIKIVVDHLKIPGYQGAVSLLQAINPKRCWTIGYEPTEKDPYDMDVAIIKYCLSAFRNMSNEYWTPCAPDFDNVLPARSEYTASRVKEMFK